VSFPRRPPIERAAGPTRYGAKRDTVLDAWFATQTLSAPNVNPRGS
jgi:hypothetical protein